MKRQLVYAAILASLPVLYINWPAIRGRECSGFPRTRDSYTIKTYTPLLLEMAEKARVRAAGEGFIVPANEVRSTVAMALHYFHDCIAERGMDRCMYVGTEPNGYLLEESKGGPPEEDGDQFRYIIPQGGGEEFGFQYWSWERWNPEYDMIFFYNRRWGLEWDVSIRRCDENPENIGGSSLRKVEDF